MKQTAYFNGKAMMPIDQFINLVGGAGIDGQQASITKLYSAVSWLYRGVNILENGVASMPFEIRRNDETIYEFDPNSGRQDTPPNNLEILVDIPHLSGMIEGAAVLRGKAYVFNVRNNAKTLELRWLLPDSIDPHFDESGQLSSFVRNKNGREQTLDVEDVLYFWMPDKFVELGPAMNFPGRAALAAAGVLHSQDDFLRGYFDRGLVAAGFLQYEDQVTPEEKERVKEWWNRMTSGLKNAFNNLIVRGDFSYQQVGQGLKDLENTALTTEQRESIATALGIPQSKMTQPSGGLGDTKSPDDLAFISDTIIPACNWIQRSWNHRYFLPRGMMMVYTPQKLPIMQQDEERRSMAFRNYVGNGVSVGYTVEETEAILGIHVPDEVREKVRQDSRDSLLIEPAIPTEQKSVSFDAMELLDKRDERDQFLRWLKNRDYTAVRVSDFSTAVLTSSEKTKIAYAAARKNRKALAADGFVDDYGDKLASFVRSNINKSRDDFMVGFESAVRGGLLDVFVRATGADDDGLNATEQARYDKMVRIQVDAVPGYVDAIYANKGAIFDAVRDNLQGLGANLGGRLQMWKNTARQFWNQGLIYGRRKESMTWRIGMTEESCNDCLFYNGQTKGREDWLTLAGVLIYPQSRALECNGYNCDCTLILN